MSRFHSGLLLASVAALVGGCQLISGLGDLGIQEEKASSGSGGSTAVSSSSSSGGVGGGATSGAGGSGGGGSGSGGGMGGSGGSGGSAGPFVCGPPGSCPEPFIDVTNLPVELLAANDTFLLWGYRTSDPAFFTVQRAPLDIGKPQANIAKVPELRGLVADSAAVYWLSDAMPGAKIESCSIASCVSPTTIATEPVGSVKALTLFSTSLYWVVAQNNMIRRSNLDADPLAIDSLTSDGMGAVRGLAIDATFIYFNRFDGAGYQLVARGKMVMDGFLPGKQMTEDVEQLARISFNVAPQQTIYWTTNPAGGAGGLYRADLSEGPGVVVPFETGLSHPRGLVGDSVHLYWIESPDGTCSTPSTIKMRSSDPAVSDTKILAKDIACPSNLVLHKGLLYFGVGSTIYRVM